MKDELLKKIADKEIVAGVVGLGYVGLPLAVEKAKAGFRTIGFDVQEEKVNLVNQGHNYIGDVVDSDLARLVEAKEQLSERNVRIVMDRAIQARKKNCRSAFRQELTTDRVCVFVVKASREKMAEPEEICW